MAQTLAQSLRAVHKVDAVSRVWNFIPVKGQGNGATAATPGGWRRRAAAFGPTAAACGSHDDARAIRRDVAHLEGCGGLAHGRVVALGGPAGKLSRAARVEIAHLHRDDPLGPALRACRVLDPARALRSEHKHDLALVLDAQHELGASLRAERKQCGHNSAESHRLYLRAPCRNDASRPRCPGQSRCWLGWGARRQSRHGPSVGQSFCTAASTFAGRAGLSAPLPKKGGGKGVKRRWFSTSGAHIAATRNPVRSVLSYPLPRGPSRSKFGAITRENPRLCWITSVPLCVMYNSYGWFTE